MRNQKRDKLGRCASCDKFKCPPGAKGRVCPDCMAERIIEATYQKVKNGQQQ